MILNQPLANRKPVGAADSRPAAAFGSCNELFMANHKAPTPKNANGNQRHKSQVIALQRDKIFYNSLWGRTNAAELARRSLFGRHP